MSPRISRLGPSRLGQGRAPHAPQRSTSSRPATNGGEGASTASVRRNLFPSHLAARRPTSDASSTSTRSTTILENPFGGGGGPSRHHHHHGRGGSSDDATTARLSPDSLGGRSASAAVDAGSEIVVRGANNEYAVVLPSLPAMQEEKSEGFAGEIEDEQPDVDARLREITTSRPLEDQDPELLEVLMGLLRRKVESLDEDRWMYQSEDLLKPS